MDYNTLEQWRDEKNKAVELEKELNLRYVKEILKSLEWRIIENTTDFSGVILESSRIDEYLGSFDLSKDGFSEVSVRELITTKGYVSKFIKEEFGSKYVSFEEDPENPDNFSIQVLAGLERMKDYVMHEYDIQLEATDVYMFIEKMRHLKRDMEALSETLSTIVQKAAYDK